MLSNPTSARIVDALVNELETADGPGLARLAESALTWYAMVDLQFRRRYPAEYAAWRLTVQGDAFAALETPAPRRRRPS